MKKILTNKYLRGILYIFCTYIFLDVFPDILGAMRETAMRTFSLWLNILTTVLFTLTISIIFSWKHILNLLRKNTPLKFSFIHLTTAVLLLATAIMNFTAGFPVIGGQFGILTLYFIFWYNLIHSVKKDII